jgi:hypothetical protein
MGFLCHVLVHTEVLYYIRVQCFINEDIISRHIVMKGIQQLITLTTLCCWEIIW